VDGQAVFGGGAALYKLDFASCTMGWGRGEGGCFSLNMRVPLVSSSVKNCTAEHSPFCSPSCPAQRGQPPHKIDAGVFRHRAGPPPQLVGGDHPTRGKVRGELVGWEVQRAEGLVGDRRPDSVQP
jgi:hypothetical protein